MSPVYEFSQFSPTEKTKLEGIADGAEVNIGEEYTTTEQTKLASVEDGATIDQTGVEMVTALEGLSGAERLSADNVKDGSTQAIPTVAQKAKIDDAIISDPIPVTEEKITQIDFVIAGNKLKATTVP